MRFSIISEIPGRTRLQLAGPVPESDLDALLKLGGDIDGVHKVRVYGRIGQMALEYDESRRDAVLAPSVRSTLRPLRRKDRLRDAA